MYDVSYRIATDSSPGHYVLFRQIHSQSGLNYAMWNSKHKVWKYDEDACGAFIGFVDHTEPIDESEAMKIIEQFS